MRSGPLLCALASAVLCSQSALSLKAVSFKYLESNSWVFKYGGLSLAVDPVLVGNLDFGIPLLYSGSRVYLDGEKELQTIVETCNYVLLSQGFDDHAHTPTLKRLRSLKPSMTYICPPSALAILKSCGIKEYNVKLISPGEQLSIVEKDVSLNIRATSGALLGPPWQATENGYIVTARDFPSVYYEPHVMFDATELADTSIDFVVTPIVAQKLPGYTLVDGGAKVIELCRLLKAKAIIPMANGELAQSGILTQLLLTEGAAGVKQFEDLLRESSLKTRLMSAPAGQEISVRV